MTKQALRSQNKCADCGYTWYPRGKNLSSVCPRCKSSKVSYAGPGLLASLAALALFFIFGHNSSSTTPPPQSTAAQASPAALIQEVNVVEPASSTAVPTVTAPVASLVPQTIPSQPAGDSVGTKPRSESAAASTVPTELRNAEPPKQDEANRIFTDEEIARMEDEKQYHGDDPIVRARLGLPSRDTKMLLK